MDKKYNIAGYCRISVDDELNRDNTSIENQKAIITDYVQKNFPGSTLTFFEDRDRSGYTFDQREGYKQMRRELLAHRMDILIVKDFSRFSRRITRGLLEVEELQEEGIRIISIGDGVDLPNDTDLFRMQLQFLLNEMPVTDTSKKVRNVIKRRQEEGKWICAAPYGYIINKKHEFEVVPAEAEIVRKVFDLYNNAGWGYKRIANYLTDQGIPTPRMAERHRKEDQDEAYNRKIKTAWSIVTIQGILDNDFYIGVFRQGKYARQKINGKDVRQEEEKQIVIEHHHQPIIDDRTFALTRAHREKRSTNNYRGIKKYDNIYSGFLFCGDCGSPMFAMSRKELAPAYTCGTYHRRGRAGCTSHHIRVDMLDRLVKRYIRLVMDNSQHMLQRLNEELTREEEDVAKTELSADDLAEKIANLEAELKTTRRQKIRAITKKPNMEEELEAEYEAIEEELRMQIKGLKNQIEMLADRRNAIIQANRTAKTAMDVFQDILDKEHLERNDLQLIIREIRVYENHLDIHLHADIDMILHSASMEEAANFNQGTVDNSNYLTQSAPKHADKVYSVHVINEGDPLEIYTEKDGGVIFRKYSPMGDLQEFASQMCEAIGSATGLIAAVADRDSVIAIHGAPRRDLVDKPNSAALERLMEQRKHYRCQTGDAPVPVVDGVEKYRLGVAAPILSRGDLMGCVMLLTEDGSDFLAEADQKIAQTAAGFLGKQMEN